MNVFILKIVALTTMIIDHIGAVIPEFFGFEPDAVNIFRVIGRVAFPIFVYLIAEGFRHTRNPAKYLARLGIFALISEIPYDLALIGNIDFFSETNIFFTLFLGGAAIVVFRRFRDESRALYLIALIIPVLIFMMLAESLSADYGAYGVLFIFLMYVIKNFKLRLFALILLCIYQHHMILSFIVSGHFAYIPVMYLMLLPATLVPALLIAFYNGKRGANLKWFFYAAYPVHLIILFLIK
ncbi:MAG: conjugal transfer protein TraX [Defluviitaleaceae bacterium]|nr:conjugal transfer protein TraX [Defluviitaleaceae bacterium]